MKYLCKNLDPWKSETCSYNLVTLSTFFLQGKDLPVMPSQNARRNSQLQKRSILGKIKLTPRLPCLVWINQGSIHLCNTYTLHVHWSHGTHYLLCCQDFSSPFFFSLYNNVHLWVFSWPARLLVACALGRNGQTVIDIFIHVWLPCMQLLYFMW